MIMKIGGHEEFLSGSFEFERNPSSINTEFFRLRVQVRTCTWRNKILISGNEEYFIESYSKVKIV